MALTNNSINNAIVANNFFMPNTNQIQTNGVINFGGVRHIMNFGTRNIYVGSLAGSTNIGGGASVDNAAFGTTALANINGSNQNTAIGSQALQQITTAANNNVAVGYQSLYQITIPNSNIAMGAQAGYNYTTTESSNIIIGNLGTIGESNVLRIGTNGSGAGQQNKAYIAGIDGVNVGSVAKVLTMATNQIGTATISAGPGTSITTGANSIQIGINTSLQITTGFFSWGGAGAYFDDTTLGSFTVLRPGTGYINSQTVTWTAPQTVTGLVAGVTYSIYVDSTGTLQKNSDPEDPLLYTDNIQLFLCMRDSTAPTNNQITSKENHPATQAAATTFYLDAVIDAIIQNNNNGANIVLNGTQKIQINGADIYNDGGLTTIIPDSGGVAVTFRKMFTNAGGKWATQNVSDTFSGYWNNAGTPTLLTAGRFGVQTLYVAKDNLNSSSPLYFTVLDTAQYTSIGNANTAISTGAVAKATNELAGFELCQLGYIVYRQSTNQIVQVTISKTTLRSTTSTSGTNTAALITVNTANFDYILSATDTSVQTALETIDNWGKWFVLTADQAIVPTQGYIADKVGLLTLTLPATSTVGQMFWVTNINTAAGWLIAQNANQSIRMGSLETTIGVGGSLAATALGDSIQCVCTVAGASTRWQVISSVGNITLV